MTLETERLRLEPWWPDDWREFRPIARDPEVMRYITGGIPWDDLQVKEFVDRQVRHFDQYGFCLWRLAERTGPGLIGFCGLQPLVGTEDIEIGWWLAREHWGKGFATEAARCAMSDGFERCGLSRIVAIARPDNSASRRVMVKLGLKYEADMVYKGVPVVRYAIDRAAAWPGINR